MSTPKIYSSCLRCERLEHELEAARKVIDRVIDEARCISLSYGLLHAVSEYDRVVAEIESKEENDG